MRYSARITQFVFVIALAFSNLAFSPSAYTNNKKGNELFQKEEYGEAEKHYREAQINDPQSESIRYNLGNVLYKKGEYEKAVTEYELATRSENKTLQKDALYNLGNSLFQIAAANRSQENTEGATEALKGAIGSYEKALTIEKEDEDTKANLAFAKKILQEIQKEQEKQKQENNDENNEENKEKKEDEKKEGENSEENDKKDKDKQDKKNDDKKNDGQDEKENDQFKENEKKEEKEKKKSKAEEKAALSKEEAERLLDSLKNEENKLQKAMRMNEENGSARGVERDW